MKISHTHPTTSPPATPVAGWLRRQGERGASLVEYALMVALIAVVCITAVTFLGRGSAGRIGMAAANCEPGTHAIPGFNGGFIAPTTDRALIDEVITVSDGVADGTRDDRAGVLVANQFGGPGVQRHPHFDRHFPAERFVAQRPLGSQRGGERVPGRREGGREFRTISAKDEAAVGVDRRAQQRIVASHGRLRRGPHDLGRQQCDRAAWTCRPADPGRLLLHRREDRHRTTGRLA